MKVLAFGDSFVKMFIHCEPEVKHWKFKGKSIRGLVKEEDAERRKIQREIRKTPNGTKVLLFFGQVDFNYVRYYKVIKGDSPLTEQTFKKYVEWVSTLNNRKNISIVSIFPSPVKKDYVIPSLISKGSYLEQQQTPEIDRKILDEYDQSAATWQKWNDWLAKYCSQFKVDNVKLFDKNYLEPQFYDVSRLTIHLRYVPVLKLVKKFVDIKFDPEKADAIEKLYQKEKVDRITNSNFRLDQKLETIDIIVQEISQKQLRQQKQTTLETIDNSTQSQNQANRIVKQLQLPDLAVKETTSQIVQRKNTADIADLEHDTKTPDPQQTAQQADQVVRSSSNDAMPQGKKKKRKNKKKNHNKPTSKQAPLPKPPKQKPKPKQKKGAQQDESESSSEDQSKEFVKFLRVGRKK